MRRTLHLAAPLAAAMLFAAACDTDDAVVDAANGDDNAAEQTDEDDDTDEDDGAGEEHAEAVWDGEELAFSRVTCQDLGFDDLYEIRGSLDGSGFLQARFALDPDASDGDDVVLAEDTPRKLELFFDEGDTIGDGRAYTADADEREQLEGSADHVAGTAHLDPDDSTQAPETHPEGGEVEFEIRCG